MSLFRTKNIESMLADSVSQQGLKKALGPLDLTFLGVGAIIGTGIFVLTGTGAVTAGPALTLSFVIAAIACGLSALAYAEFASSVPVAGSIYTYSYATLGEIFAWIIGWDLLLEYGLATSAVATGWSGYLQSLLHGWGFQLPAVLTAAPHARPGVHTLFNLPAFLIMIGVTTLVSLGVKESTRVNNIMVSVKLAVLVLVIVLGLSHVQPANWHPYMPFGWHGVFSAAAVIFFAFIGFDAVSSAAEEVRNPKRDLPIGIIGSLLLCTLLYVVVTAIMTGVVPWKMFAGDAHPVSTVLQVAGQPWAAAFVDLGAVLGMTTVMLVMCYGQTRILFAMSRDGLMPAVFSRLHPRLKTPFINTWAVGLSFGLIGAVVPLDVLAELINIGTLAAFSMVSVAVLVLRVTRPGMPRAFRCPGMPWLPMLGIASCVFLMSNLGAYTWKAFLIWLAIGLGVYFTYSRRRAKLAQGTRAE